MLSLKLKTGETVDLIDATYQQFVISAQDLAGFTAAWEKIATENALDEVSIDRDGDTIQRMKNIKLDGAQAVYNPSGTITGHFYFRGDVVATEAENDEYVRAAKILLGEEA